MADIRPTTDKGADSKIYHLWQLLSNASGNIRYALDTVSPLEPMIGAAAAAAFERGLVAHWRAWTPWVRSLRADEELNQVRNLDSMGIVGITLEAKSRPYWARNLCDDDARRAAQYATLELADFPAWLSDLAREKPAIARRIEDMQHDLVHDDYQQGETLAGLPSENTVQRWFSDRMHLKQGRSFSVDREAHVADEKEPDVRLRAKATDANVPIEIKVAESWTLPQLESALIDQLCGKYLRDRQTRHGILLLVHQTPRPVGWEAEDGVMLTFQQVVERLRAKAAELAGASTDAPQPEIAVIDVSVFASSVAARKPKTAKPNAA